MWQFDIIAAPGLGGLQLVAQVAPNLECICNADGGQLFFGNLFATTPLQPITNLPAGYSATGGVVVLHALNYALIPDGANVYEEPRVRLVDDREILFLKVFRKVRRHCDLDLVVLEKQAGAWKKLQTHARAWALEQPELESMVTAAGFVRLQWYGGYEPKPFNPATSRDLIVVGRKEKASK
jgi:hypothetical protein